MIVELVILRAKDGTADQMRAGLQAARAVISQAQGYRGSTFQQGIEDPQRFALRIEWDSVEAHTEGFRGGPPLPAVAQPLGGVHGGHPGRAALPGLRRPLRARGFVGHGEA